MEAISKFFEKVFGETPGLDVVVATITGLMLPLIIKKDVVEEWWLLTVPAVWVGALLLSGISGKLDGVMFDPLYGTRTERKKSAGWRRWVTRIVFPVTFAMPGPGNLDKKRTNAVNKLRGSDTDPSTEGIYDSAKKIFKGQEQWDDGIKYRLEYSKAARVFIIPALIQLTSVTALWIAAKVDNGALTYPIDLKPENQFLKWFVFALANPIAMYLILQLLAVAYLSLRIAHMNSLYDAVVEAHVFKFTVNEVRGNDILGPREMLSVDSVVISKCELEIFKDECKPPGK